MFLVNPNASFAYHQMDFELDYLAGSALGGGVAGTPTFYVTGSTSGGASFAQFAGLIDYYFEPINAAGVVTGPWVSLGSLQYSQTFAPSTTFVNVPVSPNTFSSLSASPSAGALAVVGEVFVAGDPASIEVSSVPEPSSGLLLALGLTAFVGWITVKKSPCFRRSQSPIGQ